MGPEPDRGKSFKLLKKFIYSLSFLSELVSIILLPSPPEQHLSPAKNVPNRLPFASFCSLFLHTVPELKESDGRYVYLFTGVNCFLKSIPNSDRLAVD